MKIWAGAIFEPYTVSVNGAPTSRADATRRPLDHHHEDALLANRSDV